MEELDINGKTWVPKENKKLGPEVIIRTYSAGVHVGNLEEEWEREGQVVTLKNARRIWRWKGANTLNEISKTGLDRSYSRISKPVNQIDIVPIEVLPVCDGVDLSEVWND